MRKRLASPPIALDLRPPLRPARRRFVCSRATTKATSRDGSRGSAATRSSSDEERQAQGAADEERVEEFLRLLLFAQGFGASRSEGAAASSRLVGVKKVQVCLNTQCSKCCCSYELLACASSSLFLCSVRCRLRVPQTFGRQYHISRVTRPMGARSAAERFLVGLWPYIVSLHFTDRARLIRADDAK